MNKYYVDYEDKSGDLCHVWVAASDKEDAKDQVYREYWDVKRVLSVYKA